MKKHRLSSLVMVTAALAVMLLCSAANAQTTISINFVGGDPNAMGPAEVAGAIPQANWNNAPDNRHFRRGPLVDQDGNTIDGTRLSYDSNNVYQSNLTDAPGDARMMKGYLDTSDTEGTTVIVEGLDALGGAYDVYVYFNGDTHTTRHGYYTIEDTTQKGADVAEFDPLVGYIQDDGTGSGGNFLVFPGLTEDTLILFASAQDPNSMDNGFRAPINGIQIVVSQ